MAWNLPILKPLPTDNNTIHDNTDIHTHAEWLPRHQGIASPQVANGGGATNILNKQSQSVEIALSSSLGVGRVSNNSSP
jgi:hypothetical protein